MPSKGFTTKVVVSISVGAFIAIGVVLIYRILLRSDSRIENTDKEEKDDRSQNDKNEIIIAEDSSKKELRVEESETAL